MTHGAALSGIRILELGQAVAGPFVGTVLGAFGADVVKVEPPDGDPIRTWRTLHNGTSLWWRDLSRNKRLIALDLRTDAGVAVLRRLLPQFDVVVENFRPGRMEAWGLGPADLHALHPRLIYCRVSGYGQTGPDRDLPGYAAVAEARAGLRHLTGEPGGPTLRTNLSLGDSIAGLNAALGVALALVQRERHGVGQVVDVSLLESVLTVMEAVVAEASVGVIRGASGGGITGVVPSGVWPCRDGEVVIGANGESLFQRLCDAMGQPQLAADPRFAGNAARVAHQAALDATIGAWTSPQTVADVVATLSAAGVPAGPVSNGQQLLHDPQLRARNVFYEVMVDGVPISLPQLGPRLERSPPFAPRPGGEIGQDTIAVLQELAGYSIEELSALRAGGVVR